MRQHTSPYRSGCLPSHSSFRDSAGYLDFQTLPWPHPHPYPNGQGDCLSSDPLSLNDFHTLKNLDTYNYLLPPHNTLDDIATEVQYYLSIKNQHDGNPFNTSVPSTTNFSFTEDSVQGPTVDHNAHSHYPVGTHDAAPRVAFNSDISYQESDGWQRQSGREAFGQQLISQDMAYRRNPPTDATSLCNLNTRGFGNQVDLTPNTSNVGGYGSSGTSFPSHPSTRRLVPRETKYNNYTSLGPSTISSSVHPSPRKRKPAQPKRSRAPGRPRRGRPPKNNNRRGKPSCPSTPCNKTPQPPPSLAPVVQESEPNRDPYEEFAKKYTTIFDEEEQQISDDLDPPERYEKSSLNAPSACHVDHNTVEDDLPLCTGHCCSKGPVLDAGLEEKPQPQTVSQARSKSHQKRQNQGVPNGIRKITSTRKRRMNPRVLYYCSVPTCRCSQERRFGGFKTAEDARRHKLRHMHPRVICKLPHKGGKEYRCRRADNLMQ